VEEIDLRRAFNAVSDVVENRPRPLREFDQIYMKAGDIVLYTEFLARKFDGKYVAFVGDGDAIGLCLAHMASQGVLNSGPSRITILDFDERLVNSVNEFANDHGIESLVSAELYNVIDPLPVQHLGSFDAFHTNPPWGQYNEGESVTVFLGRGILLLKPGGLGVCVIADDSRLLWTQEVLHKTQRHGLSHGLVLKEMIPAFHEYHLDDAPELRSCVMIYRKTFEDSRLENDRLPPERLSNFYGRDQEVRVHYVREIPRINPEAAPTGSYEFDLLPEGTDDN
jgi:predicted methyltransferase